MSEMDQAREEINQVDEEMAVLFERRMKAVKRIAQYKKDNALSVRDPARESELIGRCRRRIQNPEIEGCYVEFLESLIRISCAYQESLIRGRKEV